MGFWKIFTAVTVGGSKCAYDAEYEEMTDEKLIEEFRRWNREARFAAPLNIETQLKLYEASMDSSYSQAEKRVLSIYETYCKRNGKGKAHQFLFVKNGFFS